MLSDCSLSGFVVGAMTGTADAGVVAADVVGSCLDAAASSDYVARGAGHVD